MRIVDATFAMRTRVYATAQLNYGTRATMRIHKQSYEIYRQQVFLLENTTDNNIIGVYC